MDRAALQRLVPVALLVVLTLGAVAPIRSYDFFWHLATGRWIAEHRALPPTDPFALASDRVPWINGEWLFEVVTYAVWRATSFVALSWFRAMFVGAMFVIAYRLAKREADESIALFLAVLAFAGANEQLDVRPLTLAASFVMLAVALLSSSSKQAAPLYVALTVVWINVHPSALLAPVLAAVASIGQWSGGRQAGQAAGGVPLWLPFATAAALLVNPYRVHGIVAPIALMSYATSGAFINAEWLPSMPRFFPLLYISIAIGVGAYATSHGKREHAWRFVVGAILGLLALRHVRHQALFYAVFPLLVAPTVRRGLPSRAWLLAVLIPLAWVAVRADHRLGIDDHLFPVRAADRLKESGLAGNIYNPDQFGGFLIWSFYPDRRVLTDGRNELYHEFIPEYARARVDSRAWRALLQRYRIDLAVDEYRPPLDVIDAMTGRHRSMPASLAYFPRREWALVAYDEAGMVFARRSAFSEDLIARYELRGVVPDR